MKYFFLFFLCLATAVNSKAVPNADTYYFGSVREYPLYLHRCIATFLSVDTLLTTAECVLCADECQLQVRAFSNRLSGTFPDPNLKDPPAPETFNVTQVIYHPDYPVFPDLHNVALIKIDRPATKAHVFKYANFTPETFGINGHLYSWQFTPDMKDYYLHSKDAETVSNTACSFAMNKYIPHTFICVMGNEYFSMGPFDQGSPFVIKYKGEDMVAGIYDESGFIHNMKFVTYQSLAPFYEWMSKIINPPVTTTTKKPVTKKP